MDRDGLPRYSDRNIAIVCLSRPKAQDAYDRLENAARTVLSDLAEHNSALTIVRCINNVRQKLLEKKGHDGSMAELFNAAATAFEKGWHHFAVADDLTFRQLEGNLRVKERPDLSLVVLQIPQASQVTYETELVCPPVKAKRFNIRDAIHIVTTAAEIVITSPTRCGHPKYTEDKPFFEHGLYLHNPEAPLFDYTVHRPDIRPKYKQAIRKALTVEPALPLEIRENIESLVNKGIPLEELTDAPKQLPVDMHVISIHMLVPSVEIEATEKALNDKLRHYDENMSAVIYPWRSPLPATRRDFARLWDRIINENKKPFYMMACFLDSPSAESDDTFTVVIWNYRNPAFVFKLKLEHVVEMWKTHFKHGSYGIYEPPPEALTTAEIQYHPDTRFFPDPPRWLPVGDNDKPSVFLLISKVDKDLAKRVKSLMLSDIDLYEDTAETAYVFVDWNEDRDGNMRDMMKIATECYHYQGGRQRQAHPIFADRQTLEDGRVIMCEYREKSSNEGGDDEDDDWWNSPYEGIRYARTPAREAWIQWVNLWISNMDWEDFYGDEWSRYEDRELKHPSTYAS